MSDKFEFVGGEMYKSEFVGGISVTKVKLTITESKCRCGYFKKGQEFLGIFAFFLLVIDGKTYA